MGLCFETNYQRSKLKNPTQQFILPFKKKKNWDTKRVMPNPEPEPILMPMSVFSVSAPYSFFSILVIISTVNGMDLGRIFQIQVQLSPLAMTRNSVWQRQHLFANDSSQTRANYCKQHHNVNFSWWLINPNLTTSINFNQLYLFHLLQ